MCLSKACLRHHPLVSITENGAATVNKLCLWYKKNCSAVVCPGVMVNVQDVWGEGKRRASLLRVLIP